MKTLREEIKDIVGNAANGVDQVFRQRHTYADLEYEINAAILQAIRLVLEREPSPTMLATGERILRESGRLFGKVAHDRILVGKEYRAMTAELLKELVK